MQMQIDKRDTKSLTQSELLGEERFLISEIAATEKEIRLLQIEQTELRDRLSRVREAMKHGTK